METDTTPAPSLSSNKVDDMIALLRELVRLSKNIEELIQEACEELAAIREGNDYR